MVQTLTSRAHPRISVKSRTLYKIYKSHLTWLQKSIYGKVLRKILHISKGLVAMDHTRICLKCEWNQKWRKKARSCHSCRQQATSLPNIKGQARVYVLKSLGQETSRGDNSKIKEILVISLHDTCLLDLINSHIKFKG